MVVSRVDFAAAQPSTRVDVEAVVEFFDLGAHPEESDGQIGDAIAFLDAQLAGAADAETAAMRCQRGEHW